MAENGGKPTSPDAPARSRLPPTLGISDLIQLSLFAGLAVFALLCLFSLAAFAWRGTRGETWREHFPHLGRSVLIRAGIGLAVAGSVLLVLAASLTLNSHRPPGDVTPVIKVAGGDGPAVVNLQIDECGDPVTGTLTVAGRAPADARIYSDADGQREMAVNGRKAEFVLSDPTAKRGILSCYLQLPIVRGVDGPTTVKLTLGDEMEVDPEASIPPPESFAGGRWIWTCPADEKCPGLATMGFAIEDGAEQVIILILAALFGSIIALFVGELMIEPGRRLADRIRPK